MAKEVKPRILAQKTKEVRLKYMEKHGIDFIKMLELESEGSVYNEVILELYNKIEGTSQEMTLTGEYISLLIGSEIIFNGRMGDRIETPNYILKIKEVKIKESEVTNG